MFSKRFLLLLFMILIFTNCQNESKHEEKKLINSLNMKFIKIEPGKFVMGGTNDEHERREMYTHRVTLSNGFYMQENEVTIGNWRKYVKATNYKSQAERDGFAWVASKKYYGFRKKLNISWKNTGYDISDNYPVTFVTWEDVKNFISWLNKKDKYKYRLPTEAEWEYSCRAGSKTNYSNGQITRYQLAYDQEYVKGLDDISWYYNNTEENPKEVGLKLPNSWGLYDMHGNISEFCEDYYSLKKPPPHVYDPINKDKFGMFGVVVRGGSFLSYALFNKSYSRDFEKINVANNLRGFRLVIDLKEKDKS